nr:RNA-directed DNA polymerase, eukaryota [Tanacetum cinerariifolium]
KETSNDSPLARKSSSKGNSKVKPNSQDFHDNESFSEFSTCIHSRTTLSGGSILEVLDDMIKVGQSMGYDMEGLINRWKRETIVLGDFNEVKMEGYSFTWSHPSATKMSKLDRFLVSKGIILTFPAITAVCLDRHLSNHRPIILNEIHNNFGPTPFWIFHSWMIRFKKKLQVLKMIIRNWIRDTNLSHVGTKNAILKDLGDIDKNLDNGVASDEMLAKRMELTHKLYELKQLDLKDAAQKAKVKWAIEGDENSKFFHGIINKRRSQLAIRGVFIGDLDKNITMDEIRTVVWDCGENKSPGPDGYTFEFFRRYWNLIGLDFSSAVECLFENSSFPRGCNSSFIALIPKVVDAKFVTYFHPISLIVSVYKVVTKILANLLAMVISDLVSNTQSAFVANRQILDGPFILNEMSFKLFGFGPRWCTWICGVFSSNMALILVNESPTAEFPICCGLKQGDPLAPLLFILVMKSLHISVSRAVNDGVFKGLQIQGSVSLSHLFYADDAMFIGVGVPTDIIQQGASRIGCDIMQMPFNYLGVMVGDHMSRYTAWSNSIRKVRACLSKWKVTWDKVLTSMKNEGLGVSSFYALNRALLLKWVWRFLSQDGSLWSQVISAIYGSRLESHSHKIYSTWGCILRELQVLDSKGFDFLSHCKIRVGDGLNTRFWLDTWILDMPLSARFPRIFALENDIEASVAVKWGASSFDASFRRPVRDGAESHQWTELMSMLGTISLSSSPDRWVCDLNGDGVFRVKDIRSTLDDLFLPSSGVATRWVKYVPIKVNIFTWRARLDRLLTRGATWLSVFLKNFAAGGTFLGLISRRLKIGIAGSPLFVFRLSSKLC